MEYGRISRRSRTLGGVMVGKATVRQWKDVTLTNANVLALRATPITLVAAPGAGYYLEFVGAVLVAKTSVAAWTESTDDLAIKYTNGSGVAVSEEIDTTGLVDQVGTVAINAVPVKNVLLKQNAALVLHNTGNGEFGGGNANSVLMVRTFYRPIQLGAEFGTF